MTYRNLRLISPLCYCDPLFIIFLGGARIITSNSYSINITRNQLGLQINKTRIVFLGKYGLHLYNIFTSAKKPWLMLMISSGIDLIPLPVVTNAVKSKNNAVVL